MNLAEYYNGPFRADLGRGIEGRPPVHDHRPGEVTIQPRSISRENMVIRRWPEERRMLFASSLFLTVLSDQVCYTHYPNSYARFRELTRYPKWLGDCPGGCYNHIHPAVV